MEKVRTREKISYGLGDMGNNVAYGALGFYLVFFLTDVAGISPVGAGYVFLIIRAWNAVSDLIMGVVSDHTNTRFGRRRPYLLFGAIPLSIGFALLWQVFFRDMNQMIVYYTIAGIIFSTLYSLVSIPYNSLLPEISQDYNERTSISGYKMAFSFVGSLISAMGVTLIVDTIFPGKSEYQTSFPIMGWSLAIIIAISFLLAFLGTKERVKFSKPEKQGNILKNLLSLIKLREFKLVLGVFIFNMVSFDIIMALYIYFMKYVLKISDEISYIFMAIPLVVAIIATPLWVSISNRIGKQKAYVISAVYFVLPLIACMFIPSGNMVIVVLITIFMGVGISASQVLTFSILPDVVEVDELKNGVRREGVIYGAAMFLYKVASAIIVAAVTASLGLFGYVENLGSTTFEQPASALFGIRFLISCMPIICLVLSAVFVCKLPLGKDAFENMKRTIEDNQK